MFARKRPPVQLVESVTEDASPTIAGDVPSLKAVSTRYAELTALQTSLRQSAAHLQSEIAEANPECRARIEVDLAEIDRKQHEVTAQLRRESAEASAAVCRLVAPHYRELVARLAAALIEVHRANSAYTDFAEKLDRRSVKWARLKPAFPHFLGSPKDKNSHLAVFLKQLVADGFLERRDLPKEFGGKA
ncbi:hypothetical protein [Bradyrhizobium sp. CCBAU 53338]|uniref:hypothetical protein n=1 Tax=Bradyrhizobium sp. CCBAU 53338 TaxID=1325111 RepID=UPI00188A5A9D|nr:hypothetical protein [Bradyrhizobium sp. CCBAU 53338]QOZ52943.1 hypothetical protein XH90_17400 [Bradyrhizobium sp. CCBAU 53338]